MVKKYMLFAGYKKTEDAGGGMDDYVKSFTTRVAAISYTSDNNWHWWHIVEHSTMTIVSNCNHSGIWNRHNRRVITGE